MVGLGNVGAHYAQRLLSANGLLTVYDRDKDKIHSLVNLGATSTCCSREVAAVSDIVLLALPSPQAVEDEIFGSDGIFAAGRKGCLIIDVSTIDPSTSARLYAEAKSRSYDYLEAPMSGGEPGGAGQAGAKAGTVTFMVGGDLTTFDRARRVFEILGRHAIHLGPAGTGNTVKLISNLIAGLNMAVMAEGFVLGAAAGISHETLLKVFRRTDAKSYTMFEEFAPHLRANDYEGGFPVDLMHKDHCLAADLGRRYGVPLLFNQLAMEVYQICRAQGYGRKSHAIVVEALADLARVELFNEHRQGKESQRDTESTSPA
ncbi:MAG: NAD(P)-dependent oxidoreductase [Phycisphaerales bacterium]|nr:NAD(P)-dependent oxidoreductase [Phycisphaerales bacterium]